MLLQSSTCSMRRQGNIWYGELYSGIRRPCTQVVGLYQSESHLAVANYDIRALSCSALRLVLHGFNLPARALLHHALPECPETRRPRRSREQHFECCVPGERNFEFRVASRGHAFAQHSGGVRRVRACSGQRPSHRPGRPSPFRGGAGSCLCSPLSPWRPH